MFIHKRRAKNQALVKIWVHIRLVCVLIDMTETNVRLCLSSLSCSTVNEERKYKRAVCYVHSDMHLLAINYHPSHFLIISKVHITPTTMIFIIILFNLIFSIKCNAWEDNTAVCTCKDRLDGISVSFIIIFIMS